MIENPCKEYSVENIGAGNARVKQTYENIGDENAIGGNDGYETEYINSSNCSYMDIDKENEKAGGRKKKTFPAYNPSCSKVVLTSMTFEVASQFK